MNSWDPKVVPSMSFSVVSNREQIDVLAIDSPFLRRDDAGLFPKATCTGFKLTEDGEDVIALTESLGGYWLYMHQCMFDDFISSTDKIAKICSIVEGT